MNEDRRREIGLFRYALVRDAADPGLSKRERGQLVRALADREHLGPDGRLVRVSRTTLGRWIRAYRQGGFEALVPQPRVVPPRTPAEMLELAFALKRERPERTAAQVREIMLTTAGEGERVPGLRTLQTHLAREGLNVRADGRVAGEGLWPLRSLPCATSCGPGTGSTARCWPAAQPGGRCCWRSSTITAGCWSGGGGAPARTCSVWRPRSDPG